MNSVVGFGSPLFQLFLDWKLCHNRCNDVCMLLLNLHHVNTDGLLRDLPTGPHRRHTESLSCWIYNLVWSETLLLKTCALLGFPLGVMVSCTELCGVPWFPELVIFWWVLLLRYSFIIWRLVEIFFPPDWYGPPLDTIDSRYHFYFQIWWGLILILIPI